MENFLQYGFWIWYCIYLLFGIFGCICCTFTFDFICKRYFQEDDDDDDGELDRNYYGLSTVMEMGREDEAKNYAALM